MKTERCRSPHSARTVSAKLIQSGRLHVTILAIACTTIGCTDSGPPVRELTPRISIPVSGVVHLDGQPTERIQVLLHRDPSDGVSRGPVIAMTDSEGRFQAEIPYVTNTQLPTGKYHITFRKPENVMSPVDELQEKYAAPGASEHIVTVAAEGDTFDIGTVELQAP